MDTSSFDEQIRRYERQIEDLKVQMETNVEQLRSAAEETLTRYFDVRAKEVVLEQSARTEELGKEGIENFRRGLEKAKELIPQMVEENLNDDRLWYHRGPDTPPPGGFFAASGHGYDAEGNLRNAIMKALQKSVGSLHDVFKTYEFHPGTPREGFYVPASAQMNAVLQQYSARAQSLEQAEEGLRAVEKDRSEAVARDLWEST